MSISHDITLVHFQPPAPIVSPPLGQLCLLSALEREGIHAELRDLQLFDGNSYDTMETAKFILDSSAPIIGIGTMVHMMPHLVLTLKEIKRRDPGRCIILGGPGPSSAATALMDAYPFADYILCGEAESRLPDLVHAIQSGSSPGGIHGLVYRDAVGNTIRTEPYDRIRNPDLLPLPAYHRIEAGRYNGPIPIEMGRGCPYGCTFCETSRFWGRDLKVFSTDRLMSVVSEIAERFPDSNLGFVDDTFGVMRSNSFAVMDILRKADIGWHCSMRIEQIDEPYIGYMAESGCYAVFIGVESGSDSVLSAIRKRGIPAREIPERVSILSDRFYRITASFIWGFPFETVQDLTDSIALAGELKGNGVVTPFHLLSALPSAEITGTYADRRRFEPSLLPDLSGVPLNADHVSMIDEHVEVFSSFYHFSSDTIPLKRRLVRRVSMGLSEKNT